jgi:predicted nucleotidyltransferase component of viral defense system
MLEKYYQDRLYPFQDKVLKAVESLDIDFHLTGGTALGRCYLGHRYSDDLGFFVNNHPEFKTQCNNIINLLKIKNWKYSIPTATE